MEEKERRIFPCNRQIKATLITENILSNFPAAFKLKSNLQTLILPRWYPIKSMNVSLSFHQVINFNHYINHFRCCQTFNPETNIYYGIVYKYGIAWLLSANIFCY